MSRIIPFGWLPGHWGLTGQTREICKAEYELEGFERDVAVANIKFKDSPPGTLAVKLNNINYIHSKITYDERQRADINALYTGDELTIELLKLDFSEGKLTDNELAKGIATAKKEPWVLIKDLDYDKEAPSEGSMELDWNEYFIADLTAAGYEGITDEEIVDKWLNELCRNIAVDAFSGIGDFDEQIDTELPPTTNAKVDGKWTAS